MRRDKFIGIIALVFFIIIELSTYFSTLTAYIVPVIIITISTILICKILKNKGITLEISKVDITMIAIIIIAKLFLMSFIIMPLNKLNEFEDKINLTANVTSLEEYRDILGLEKEKYKSEMENKIKVNGKYDLKKSYKFIYNSIDSYLIHKQDNNKQKMNINEIREIITTSNEVAQSQLNSEKKMAHLYIGLDIGIFIYSTILMFVIYRKNRF